MCIRPYTAAAHSRLPPQGAKRQGGCCPSGRGKDNRGKAETVTAWPAGDLEGLQRYRCVCATISMCMCDFLGMAVGVRLLVVVVQCCGASLRSCGCGSEVSQVLWNMPHLHLHACLHWLGAEVHLISNAKECEHVTSGSSITPKQRTITSPGGSYQRGALYHN